jgi:hypothetical protein
VRPSGLQLIARHPDGHVLAHPVTPENVLVVAERLAPLVPDGFVWEVEEA